ncbi:hypothetical protein TNCV_3459621 [Trichonephila clavipes]|nr:hypothetical protein TNCV_3459621 [Trichonephila clavipes]
MPGDMKMRNISFNEDRSTTPAMGRVGPVVPITDVVRDAKKNALVSDVFLVKLFSHKDTGSNNLTAILPSRALICSSSPAASFPAWVVSVRRSGIHVSQRQN